MVERIGFGPMCRFPSGSDSRRKQANRPLYKSACDPAMAGQPGRDSGLLSVRLAKDFVLICATGIFALVGRAGAVAWTRTATLQVVVRGYRSRLVQREARRRLRGFGPASSSEGWREAARCGRNGRRNRAEQLG